VGGASWDSPPAPLAETERELLCDLLDELGPHAATLCEGWDTHHLAAHLWLRESSPLGLFTVTLGSAEATVANAVASSEFGELVDRLRAGPTSLPLASLPQLERLANGLEFFIHHEDVRRAQLRWTVRDLPAGSQDEIWSPLRALARVTMRRSPVGAVLRRTDTATSTRAAKGANTVTIRGLPSELALFAFGRTEVARVELDGSSSAVRALCATPLRI
jgi:uncharacterized protein (TIGR03085 family)